MTTDLKYEQLEKLVYKRTHAGQEGRGGKTYPEPTRKEDSQCITLSAVLLLNAIQDIEELQRSNKEQKTAENKSLFIRVTKFCKDIIQKPDNNLFALGALLLASLAFGKIFSMQVIKANIK